MKTHKSKKFYKLQVRQTERNPVRPIITLSEDKGKGEILKRAREKPLITDILAETLEARRQWGGVFKALKKTP